ncbi:MAG TPA: acetate--CoA ligase family protein, partial [Synergistales bacterium]|nr:acetate--CoA ligase family protein [Synergistales bacterium]
RDPVFGPFVAVGLGGIYVEVLKDLSLRHAPVDVEEARRMIASLRGFPLLSGARGSVPKDTDALAGMVARVSLMALAEESLAELDINPVFVLDEGGGAVAVDAAAVRDPR